MNAARQPKGLKLRRQEQHAPVAGGQAGSSRSGLRLPRLGELPRLPPWLDNAAIVAAAGYLGYRLGAAMTRERP